MNEAKGESKRYILGYRKFFKMFKEEFPLLGVRGTSYEPYGYMEIKISIPDKGQLIYNPVGTTSGKIRWLKIYENETESKRQELEKKKLDELHRKDICERFLDILEDYINEYHVTQNDISRLTGISRQTINEYLNGRSIPKVTTMRRILEALGIKIDI